MSLRILYFGIFNPDFSRNAHYIKGLRQNGVEVTVCTERGGGVMKYIRLARKFWSLRNSYDVMIVGYPGYTAAPFARVLSLVLAPLSRKPILLDALSSFYEAQIISRDAYRGNPFRIPYVWLVDWLATRLATRVIVETESQKEYFIKKLGLGAEKIVVAYTGADDEVFGSQDGGAGSDAQQNDRKFTVLFRGRIMKEAGVDTVVRTAKILENAGADLKVLIIGFGWGQTIKDFNQLMTELAPKNVEHITQQIPLDELVLRMKDCDVSLGQFADNERLERTIPHKAFESLALGLPYITARAKGIEEILTDGETCIMVDQANPEQLAEAILKLKGDAVLRHKLAQNGYKLYHARFTPREIVQPIIAGVQSLL